ncbi:MAG: VCBS repeat-containing protein [Armatimonadota bacterium]|nr:VCBS repeat-containing protein [Armatimonadota bacterium]
MGRKANCVGLTFLAACVLLPGLAQAVPSWTSPNRYRVLLTVNNRGVTRVNSPAQVNVDFPQLLTDAGASGSFDESTIEVVAYDGAGQPKEFDASRAGYERYLLPWRAQRYYGVGYITLSFVIPNQNYTQYAVYFDTKESGRGKPQRYGGIVGDGDRFTEGYKRREINACHFDTFVDFDGDGDPDLFKGGTEPFIYCYENAGGGRFVDRGKLTSGGQPWDLTGGQGRAWVVVEFNDWDGDGDQDLFASYSDGPQQYTIQKYENVTTPGGQLTFQVRGQLTTQSGASLGSNFFSAPTIVDWDGDGKKDVMIARSGLLEFHKNVGTSSSLSDIQLTEGVNVKANGVTIRLGTARFDFADIDSDGDLDAFAGTGDGSVYWFRNVGTRTNPVLATGRIIAFYEFMDSHSGVKIADFDGDGLPDMVCGRFWERTNWDEQPRFFGRLYKNVGTATAPRFAPRDAQSGSPYTEQFQICDAVRQNGVRATDWDGDGKKDLIASDSDGYTWFFRNTTSDLFPVSAAGQRLAVNGQPIRAPYDIRWAGYARSDVVDWDNDSDLDLIVGDLYGRYTLYINSGSRTNPILSPGVPMSAGGQTIQHSYRATPLICDWDSDGKKDLVGGEDTGVFFYRNVGTDANPSFALPETVMTNLGYPRPNMGSFVDWDKDGKKDLILGEYENRIRFYKNVGLGTPGSSPQFADNVGTIVVDCPGNDQLVSGAEVKDWNGDDDLDILTGQGHGGSGLRFYDRNYIEDTGTGLFPIVTIGATERAYQISEAKTVQETESVLIPQGIVTAVFTDYFYIESSDKRSGIRVWKANHGLSIGQMVDVTGTASVNPDGERYILAGSVVSNGSGTVSELLLNSPTLGGGDFGSPSTGSGQRGVEGGVGVNNVGLLVRVPGRCSLNLSSIGDYYNNRYLFLDDGGGVTSYYRDRDGSYKQVRGVKVEVNDPSVTEGSYLIARGISSIELVNGFYQRRALPRPGMGDVIKV